MRNVRLTTPIAAADELAAYFRSARYRSLIRWDEQEIKRAARAAAAADEIRAYFDSDEYRPYAHAANLAAAS
jgi:hypothetical protein